MYGDVTEVFKKTIRSPSRTFKGRLKIKGKWVDSKFKKISYETGSSCEESLTLGSAVSAKIELTIVRINQLFENTEIPVEIGLLLPSGTYEYVPLGIFTAEHPTSDQDSTTFTAYDRMMKTTGLYVSKLKYPAKAAAVLDEISAGCGVPIYTSGLSNITINTQPVGYTYREMIGYIASLAGGFACVDRTGTIVIRWYADSDYRLDYSRIMSFEKDESDYHLDMLTCNTDASNSLAAGNGTLGITFDNPFMTQDRLNAVYKKVKAFTYRGAKVKTLGDIRMDPWDVITVVEGDTEYKMPVMNMALEYDGGLAMTITSYGKTETETQTDYKGPSTKLAERTYAEMMLTKELVSKKVDAEWVKANTVQAETVVAINNELENIRNNYLKSNIAEIKYATIESLKGLSGEFEQLKTNDFTAVTAKVNDLTVGVEKVNTLMFGSASGGSLTTEFSNSVISLIGDAQIKSAMIESIDAKKITSLDVNTTSVNIHSESGLSRWKDNTIVISDGTRTRVQIGKDANADYNMYVWDKKGNLLFDALGLTAKGIQREIIRNDMVSQDADISAEKLDIGSLFEVINKDGSHTLKSSKIYVDSDKQTLDVSFKSITTKTDTAVTAANKADTKAQSVINRANAGEFKGDKGDKGDTGATGKGVLSITPQYYLSTSNTTQSGGSWSNTRPSWVAGRYYWTRDYIQWTDGSVTASTPQLATDLNNLYSSLQTVTNTVSSQGTQLSTVQGQISSKVWQQDITTAVTNLQIGGRNLFLQSGHWTTLPYTNYWFSNGGGLTLDTATKYLGYNTLKTIVGNGIAGYWQELDVNKTYTYSAMVKTSVAFNGDRTIPIHYHCSTDMSGPNGSIDILAYKQNASANEWTLLYLTFKPRAKYFRPFIYIGGSYNITFNIAYLKLEEGNKATDWTPAPEDVDANISSVEGKITTVSNQYTTLNQSFTSLKATVNSNTTAISKKADNSTVTEINNRVTTLTADLSGIKQSISATYVTKTDYKKEIERLGDNINNVDDKASAAQDWCQTIEDNITDHYSTTVQMNNAITQAVSAESNSIKLEVSGTYATKNDISNLQIGGRNLLTGSAGWTKANPAKSTNAADGYVYIGGKVYLENGKTYTLQAVSDSVWATGHGGQTGKATIWLHGLGDGFHRVFCGDGKTSGRYTWTFVHTSATQNCEIRINGYSKVTSFWDIKIESGNKATDWTPAQEDVNAKFNNYATTASLTAYIAKTDTGALKSCIEAIADTINLTAGGAINISGNKSVNISGNKFSLNSSGTKISSAGYLQTVNAKLGEWNVDSKAIYCVTTDKVYTAYLQNPDYVVGAARENAWVYSVQKNSYPTFYVTSEGELYTRKIKPCVNMEGLNVRVTSSASGIDIFWYTWNFRGTGLLLVNCAVWTDETDDYGTTSCAIYINDACVTANTHRYGENSNSVELDAGCSFAYWVRDSDIKLTIKAGSTKDGIKTFTRTIQTLFGLEQL